MPVELMLLAVNSNLFVFLFYPDDMMGRLFAFSVFTILEPSLSSQQWGLGTDMMIGLGRAAYYNL